MLGNPGSIVVFCFQIHLFHQVFHNTHCVADVSVADLTCFRGTGDVFSRLRKWQSIAHHDPHSA